MPVPNNHWDKETLSVTELEGIRPFLKQIRAMKDQGLSGVGVVANFIRRRIQPLQERIHYGFKYTGLEDPAWVTADELTEGEVLKRIQNVLVSVQTIPYQYPEHDHQHLPAAISILTLQFVNILILWKNDSCVLIAGVGAKFQLFAYPSFVS